MSRIKKNYLFIFLFILPLYAISDLQSFNQYQDVIKEMNAENQDVAISSRHQIPIVLNNLNDTKPKEVNSQTELKRSSLRPHVVVVGAGTAGLTAALTLSNQGYSVTLIERSSKIGGLASGGHRGGVAYSNGDAYYSSLIPEQEQIYKQLGLKDYFKTSAIHEPSDSLYVEGGILLPDGTKKFLFKNFWEDKKVLNELPAGFALTKWAHFKLNAEGLIPNQPIEDAKSPFDKMTYTELLDSQLEMLKKHLKRKPKDKTASHLMNRIQDEIKMGRIDMNITDTHHGIMDPVIRFYADNYGHSALGGHASEVNAAAALNFVFSEMSTRYTHPHGIGEITRRALKILEKRSSLVKILTSSEVTDIIPQGNTVNTIYVKDGERIAINSDRAILSIPLDTVPWIIQDFERIAPQHNKIIQKFIEKNQFTDYIVTPVFIEGHPTAVRLTYDLWLGRMHGFNKDYPSDFISAEWIKYKGYTSEPSIEDKNTAITIYHPRGSPHHKYSREQLIEMAENDIEYMLSIYNPIQKEHGEEDLKIKFAEINYWPKSIMRPMVGHFADIKTLRKPIAKTIRLAHSNLDTPSHEGAQYRGWRAAVEVGDELKNFGIMPIDSELTVQSQ